MDYSKWCGLSNEALYGHDLARLNLICAVGLPGAEELDIDAACEQCDEWAQRVASGLRHDWRSRAEHEHCTPHQYRMLSMVTVLQLELGVHYRTELREGPCDLTDSRNLFIHGLLQGVGGTCASMPVLYVVIGHRLDYPLFLSRAHSHWFVRWEGLGERFNVEATTHGCGFRDDDHYRVWPKPITRRQDRFGRLLTNLSPRQNFSDFLRERADCLLENHRFQEAVEAYYWATQLDEFHCGQWAIASSIFLLSQQLDEVPEQFSPEARVELCKLNPQGKIEQWAGKQARKYLTRLLEQKQSQERIVHVQQAVEGVSANV